MVQFFVFLVFLDFCDFLCHVVVVLADQSVHFGLLIFVVGRFKGFGLVLVVSFGVVNFDVF